MYLSYELLMEVEMFFTVTVSFFLHVFTYLLHIKGEYQCDKAVNKNDTREVI